MALRKSNTTLNIVSLSTIEENQGGTSDTLVKTNNVTIADNGNISVGTIPPDTYGDNEGIFMGYSSGPQLSIFSNEKNYLKWDGTKLLIQAMNFTLDENGNITANDVDLTGKITAEEGRIGGWVINEYDILSDDGVAFINSGSVSGSPAIGIGATGYKTGSGVWFGKENNQYKFFVGDINTDNYIAFDGSTLDVKGITAEVADITTKVSVGATSPCVVIDGIQKSIYVSDYVNGTSGWKISHDGTAEFANVKIRGEIRSSVFSKSEVVSTAGTLGVFKSAGKLLNSTSSISASSGTFSIDIEDPSTGHAEIFEVGDILRVKDGLLDNWMIISGSIVDNTTYYTYQCELKYGTPSNFFAGTTVIDYGVSQDGYLIMTADETDAPYYSVRIHSGSPWLSTSINETARMGNLAGYLGLPSGSPVQGIGIGGSISGSPNYLRYDTGSGLQMTGTLSVGNGNSLGNEFTGVKIAYPPVIRDTSQISKNWHIASIYRDAFVFGIIETGEAVFAGGAGTISDEGIKIEGILNAIAQEGTYIDTSGCRVTRYGRLGMTYPESSAVPAFGIEYSDEPTGSTIIENGLFTSGSLNGWKSSASSSLFYITEDYLPTYVSGSLLESGERTLTSEETLITSSQGTLVPGDKYRFSFFTRDVYGVFDTMATENVVLDQANPDFAHGSISASNTWLEAGYYTGQQEQRSLLRFDNTNASKVITVVDEAGLLYYIKKNGLTTGSTTISISPLLTQWVKSEATWLNKNTTTTWSSSGAKGLGTDISTSPIGDDYILAINTLPGYRYTDVDADFIQSWVTGSSSGSGTMYGLCVSGCPLTGNNAIDFGTIEEGLGSILRISERPAYKVEVKWYTTGGSTTGSAVRTDVLATNNDITTWNKRESILTVPSTATNFDFVITATRGKKFQVANIDIKRIGVTTKMYLDPAPTVQDNLGTRRILTTVKELSPPSTPIMATRIDSADDSYTVSLLHLDGADGATTTTDEIISKTWTFTGDCSLLTSASKFGSAGYHGDSGNTTYLKSNTSTDWQFGNGDFSVDFWLLTIQNGSTYPNFIGNNLLYTNSSSWLMYNQSTIKVSIAGTVCITGSTTTFRDGNYHHIAFSRSGNNVYLFVDGVLDGYGTTSASISSNAAILIGTQNGYESTRSLIGNMDEVRISKGIARWTSNFTVPSGSYVSGDAGNLEVGNYLYKYLYEDDSGKTTLGTVSNTLTTLTGGKKANLLVPGGGLGVKDRNVYRTKVGGSVYYFLTKMSGSTSGSYLDNIPDAQLEEGAPLLNTTSSRPQYPRSINISGLSLVSNTDTAILGTGVTPYLYTSASSANNSDYFEGAMWVAEGIYDLYFHVRKESTAGKIDIYVDNTLVASGQDLYAASGVAFVLTVNGVNIIGSGYHTLRIVINGKHTSSTDYTFACYAIMAKPTSY